MKIEKQTGISTDLDTRSRARLQPSSGHRQAQGRDSKMLDARMPGRMAEGTGGFSLQLNQQLSSMQATDRYLADLANQLGALKLSVSRQISSPLANEREAIAQGLEQANQLLRERSQRTSQSLDANFTLRLNEPLRSRFSLPGLESAAAIQASGRETLVFTAGRALAEPLAVVLDDDMSEEQLLRNFNAGLGSAGIRAELDQQGRLAFSMPENDFQPLKAQLSIKGEGKLFPVKPSAQVQPREEGLLGLDPAAAQESARELRQLLDTVVAALERIGTLRQQLHQRQEDVREFLASQESQDEKQWALNFASAVFNIKGRTASSYSVVSQTVIAQAQLSRFAVVSLLS